MPQMVVPESSRGQEGPDEAPGSVLKRKVSYLSARMQKFPQNVDFTMCFGRSVSYSLVFTSKTDATQRQRDAGGFKAPLPTPLEPLQLKTVWGITHKRRRFMNLGRSGPFSLGLLFV